MRFFKVRAKVDKELTDGLEGRSKKSRSNEFNKRVEAYAKEIRAVDEAALEKPLERDFYINFSSIEMESAVLIMATERYWESSSETKVHFSEYLKTQKYGGRIEKMDEITGKVYRGLLADAAKNDFIDGFDDTMKRYGMNTVLGQRWNGFSFEEFLLDGETPDQKTSLRRASAMGTVPTLCEEIERIYATTREVWKPGNPVHYTIAADDGKDKDAYFMLLMKALYASGRISGKRYTQIDYEELCEDYNSEKLDEVYRLQASGVVAIRIGKDNPDEGETVTGAERHAADICRAAMKWKNLVLTVFLFQRDSERVQDNFFSEMDYISLIRIEESVVFDNDAKAFLRSLAKENKVDVCKGLYKTVGKGVGYSKRDLRDLFDQWYSGHLKNNEFPQYSASAIAMSKSGRGPKGSGIDELNGLIGLAETKALVSSILDFAKAQKMYAFDKAPARQSLHMIFTGNPGTAKTTVARLVARILKENEVLRVGDLIEVGRADIIGKYVGHTAPLVKQTFRKARGSVLFIDEAYSLVDDRDGLYGDEAITTIVQEMENLRDEVVVIFAGYPDKMEGFLAKNPGLRSRIGFHVNFPDYTPGELYEIMELLAKNDRLELAGDVRGRVYPMIGKASGVREFGNGRYVRNLLEKARMRQATRLIGMDQEKVTEQVAATLVAEDFEEIRLSVSGTGKRVGFI